MAVIYGPQGEVVSRLAQEMPDPLDMGVANNNWLNWAMAYTEGTINPDSIGVDDYIRMYENDDVLYSSTEMIKRRVIKGLGEYVNFDETQQDHVRKGLKNIRGSFLKKCEGILMFGPIGFSVTEIIYGRAPDGGVTWRNLQTLHPKSLTLDIHRDGPDKGELKWIKQWWNQGRDRERNIPISKVIHIAHGNHWGNPYGTGDYKRAWRLWKAKEVLLKAYLITLERYGCPLTIATTPDPSARIMVNGKPIVASKYLTQVMDALSTRGSMVVPQGTEIEINRSQGGQLGQDFLDALKWLNEQMEASLGKPKLITGTGDVGSHSLGIQQSDNFDDVTDGHSDELTEALIEQMIRPYIEFQFGPQEDYGLFLCEHFDAGRAAQLADVANKLKQADIIDTQNLDDVNFFREEIGLNPWTEADMNALADRTMVAPGMPPMPGDPLAAAGGTDPKPDTNSFSRAGRRRLQAYARRELQRRILREVMRAAV